MISTRKIALLTNSFVKTSETFIVRQAVALNATVLCKKKENSSTQNFNLNLTTLELGTGGINNSYFQRVLRKLGISDNYGYSKSQLRDLEEKIKTNKFEAILAQYGPNGIASAPIAKKNNILHVTHFHGYDISSKLNELAYQRDLRRLATTGSKFVVVNQEQFRLLEGYGFPKENIHLIPCGVPIDEFRFDARETSGNMNCLFVGRLVLKKDPFRKVIAEVPEARLTILGDGPLFDKCQKFITTHHLSEQVSMLGSQPQSVVKSELKKAAIYVQHSVTDKEGNKEGWPISIAEAAASGLPIVSTRHAGIKDQVLEGKSGFLVDERDYANMAAKIIQLLRNDSEREALGKESFRHITEVGSLDSQLSKLSEVLSK